ncbi:MAG: hypothetical protein ACYDC3_10695 [Candidatus Binataceae bacterium]
MKSSNMADEEVMTRLSGAAKLADAADAAIASVTDPELAPQVRAAEAIRWAAARPCRSDAGRAKLAALVADFARSARQLLQRGDFVGVDRLIAELHDEAWRAAQIPPPGSARVTAAELAGVGWNQLEHNFLQAILNRLPEAERTVASFDTGGVTLNSGRRITREEIRASSRPAGYADKAWNGQFPVLADRG